MKTKTTNKTEMSRKDLFLLPIFLFGIGFTIWALGFENKYIGTAILALFTFPLLIMSLTKNEQKKFNLIFRVYYFIIGLVGILPFLGLF